MTRETPGDGPAHADVFRQQPFGRHVGLPRAERELERVLRHEHASLLRQAAALKAARAPMADVTAPFPLLRPSLRIWRRRVRSALWPGTSDHLDLEGERLLTSLVDRPVKDWPNAVRLAQYGRRLEDGEFARVCLGYALLFEDEPHRAERVFAGLFHEGNLLRHRWRILEGLSLAHEALGRPRLALGAIEAAADEPLCGISALVNGLHLALRVGDVERTRRAAARLDLLADPFSPEFSAAVRFLKNRVSAFFGGLPWQPKNEARSLFFELLKEERSASGRVCRALF